MRNPDDDLLALVRQAQQGDRAALAAVVRAVQDRIHHLAIRMLVNPEDARDATQEILILIVTRLSTFRGTSAFNTWVYRVATYYLLTARKVAARSVTLSFDQFAADLNVGLVADPPPAADDLVMLNELRISCTMAMLLCLDQNHRVAYVLGDILEFDHTQGAEILDISPVNFRKRLSRARADVVAFTATNCGLASSKANCTCPRRLPAALAQGRVDRANVTFATRHAPTYDQVLRATKGLVKNLKVLKLQTTTGQHRAPDDLGAHIAQIVQARS